MEKDRKSDLDKLNAQDKLNRKKSISQGRRKNEVL